MNESLICANLSVGDEGVLRFAGQDVRALAGYYGTPLYLMDERRIRDNCRRYRRAAEESFGGQSCVLYASKAASFRYIYEIVNEEGLHVDVVSPGEIHTAAAAGFPMERVWFHSNNKSDEDIAYAVEMRVGFFVVDCMEELEALDRIAGEAGIRQDVLLRVTPGIDPHTFEAVATGKVDSKFGFPMADGQADEAFHAALRAENLALRGFHCHVGSQVFDSDVFLLSAEVMLDYMARLRAETGYVAERLDLGGGYGVRYLPEQPELDIEGNIACVGAFIREKCAALGYPMPAISLEPGRSIVADAGLTLYTVGAVKRIPGLVNYVSVDGGMTDNVRYAMYQAPYTVLPADRMNEPRDTVFSVVGRCCESGDVIQPGVPLPDGVRRGDLIAVCTTGAYNYSMASNYNRIPRPPVVMLRDGDCFTAVRRESLEDLLRLDA